VIRFPGSIATEAWGINNHDEIVRLYHDNTGRVHGFTFKKGAYTTVDFPGSFATELHKINAEGDMVGNYQTQDARFHGFSLDKGKFRTIDNPKNTEITLILGLNNRDQIVGGGSSPGQLFEGNCEGVLRATCALIPISRGRRLVWEPRRPQSPSVACYNFQVFAACVRRLPQFH
jgi:hypothetical protein